MEYVFRNAGRLKPWVMKMIKDVVDECKICMKNLRSRSRPTVALPRASEFNSVVTLEFGKVYVLWIVCALTWMMRGVVLTDKKAESIIKGLHNGWCLNFGFLTDGFYVDNGDELRNYKMEESVSKFCY